MGYVKFQKGSMEAYENLIKRGRIEEDTLYFIYDKEDYGHCLLYLGYRLIGGNEQVLRFKFDDLDDVQFINEPKPNQFIIYNGSFWQEIDLEWLIQLIKDNSDLDSLIKTVNENFKVINGELQLNKINISQVQNLQELLDKREKEIQDNTNKLNEIITISTVDSDYFHIIDEEKKLTLNDSVKANLDLIPIIRKDVGDLSKLIGATDNSNLVDEINSLKNNFTWQNI